jgi:hypothetical protein
MNMKYLGMIATALILVACNQADASNRSQNGLGRGEGVNSAAAFAAESVEHALRQMVNIDQPQAKDLVVDVAATLVNPTTARVEIKLTTGGLSYDCFLFDDFSKGGTEVKKDVRCNRVR